MFEWTVEVIPRTVRSIQAAPSGSRANASLSCLGGTSNGLLLRGHGTLTMAAPLLKPVTRDSPFFSPSSHPSAYALTHPRRDGLISTVVP